MNAHLKSKSLRVATAAAFLLVTAMLVACGGGGGESQSGEPGGNTPETPSTPGTTVSAGTAVTYAAGTVPALALETVNAMIGHCGYPRMASVTDLSKAAQAHADYIARNGYQGGHEEIPGRPGFTGVTFSDRIIAAGGTSERAHNASEGVGGYGGLNGRYTTALLAAPYHQASLLSQWTELGIGNAPDPDSATYPEGAMSNTVVLNPGGSRLNAVPNNEVRTFPCDGSTKISGSGGPEVPDPAPELGGRFGPGLNFETNKDGAIEVTSISLRNIATGDMIPVQKVKGHNLEGVAWRSVWISKDVLHMTTAYRVEARGNVYPTKSMTGSATAWSKSYTFTTY